MRRILSHELISFIAFLAKEREEKAKVYAKQFGNCWRVRFYHGAHANEFVNEIVSNEILLMK